MSSRRTAKVAEAIREVVSTTVLFGLKDPRVQNVTVLGTEVSPDLRYAKVLVTIRGDEKTQALSMRGLNAARGFVQSQIADQLQLRYTPILSFVLDDGVKKSIAASALIAAALHKADANLFPNAEVSKEEEAVSNSEESDPEEHEQHDLPETDHPEDVPRP